MWYAEGYETSYLCPGAQRPGARDAGARAARQRRLYAATQPDAVGQRPWRAGAADRAAGRGEREDGAANAAHLQARRPGCAAAWLLAPPHDPSRLHAHRRRGVARALAAQAARDWQADQRVDPRAGGRREWRAGTDCRPRDRRGEPQDAQTAWPELAPRPALDHQSRPGRRPQKARRDRLLARAHRPPDWRAGDVHAERGRRLAE